MTSSDTGSFDEPQKSLAEHPAGKLAIKVTKKAFEGTPLEDVKAASITRTIDRMSAFTKTGMHFTIVVWDSKDRTMGHDHHIWCSLSLDVTDKEAVINAVEHAEHMETMSPPKEYHYCGNPKCECYFKCNSTCTCFRTFTTFKGKPTHKEGCDCKCTMISKDDIYSFKCKECKI